MCYCCRVAPRHKYNSLTMLEFDEILFTAKLSSIISSELKQPNIIPNMMAEFCHFASLAVHDSNMM